MLIFIPASSDSIHVLDVNDNTPVFQGETFVGRVSETAPLGTLVFVEGTTRPLVIKASDADAGVNSLLYFEILDHQASRVFSIDESTGALRVTTDRYFRKTHQNVGQYKYTFSKIMVAADLLN